MLNNLILAYRSKFYDWDSNKYKELYSKNKAPFWVYLGFFFLFLCLIGYCVYSGSLVFLVISLLCTFIFIIVFDRFAVKQFQQIISRRKDHLNEVVLFLKTTIPENNLYNEKQIDELVNRLTQRIESSIPFNRLKTSITHPN